MKRAAFSLVFFLAAPLLAASDNCGQLAQLASLHELRSFMIRHPSSYDIDSFVDKQLNVLREPLPEGGFRWVRWARPSGDPEYDKKGHTTVAVYGTDRDNFEANGEHAFAVRVAVPQKKSLFSGNKAVYVGTVHITYVANGRSRSREEEINRWMNPDTSKTIDLGTIADRVDVSLDAATNQRDVKNALVEIHILKAAPQDDPENPNYPAVESLKRVRRSYDADAIDDEIARVESQVFPGAEPVPLYAVVRQLRKAEELIRSSKEDDQKQGDKLLKEALRRLRY